MSFEGLETVAALLAELNDCLESNDCGPEVNSLLHKATLNLSTLTLLDQDPYPLLLNIKKVLVENKNPAIDFELLVQLLDALISVSSFEDVLKAFEIEDLVYALTSSFGPLIKSACKVISKSYPAGLFATSPVFDILLNSYFRLETDIDQLNAIENVFQNLANDELVRRKIMKDNLSLLMDIRKKYNPVQLSRLFELLLTLFQYMNHTEFEKDLFMLSKDEIMNFITIDIILFINAAKYYSSLLDIVGTVRFKESCQAWALHYILPVIPVFGEIYNDLEKFIDVRYFGKTYLFQIFRKVSYIEDLSFFRELDYKYIHISLNNSDIMDFLAFVNPTYLLENHSKILEDKVMVTPSFLGVLRNLVSDEGCFNLLKDKFSSESILQMPYFEQMVLLEKMTLFSHTTHFLLWESPRVMSNLIGNEDGHVIETESVKMRRKVFENLLRFTPQELNVWNQPLRDEYANIVNGGHNATPQPNVATTFL